MIRSIGTYLLFIIQIVSLMTISACNKQKDAPVMSKDAKETTAEIIKKQESFFLWHVKGSISRFDTLDITFKSNYKDKIKVDKIIKIDPKVDYKVEWKKSNSVSLIPKSPLKRGTQYNITVDINKLPDATQKLPPYKFSATVIPQSAEINIGEFKFNQETKLQEIEGTIELADKESLEAVQKVITADIDGESKELTWTASVDEKKFRFKITDIARKEELSRLNFKWDLNSIGIKDSNSRSLNIEPEGKFAVKNIQKEDSDNSKVLIYFNDLLDKDQKLKGLIEIKNVDFSTSIDGSLITVYINEEVTGEATIIVHPGIKSFKGKKLKSAKEKELTFKVDEPEVKFVGTGAILPKTGRATVPFEAVSVDSVQVTAYEVYENNLAQMLQVNSISGKGDISRVGRAMWRKSFTLPGSLSQKKVRNRYNLDVSELIKKHPNRLYRLELSINRGNSLYPCNESDDEIRKEKPLSNRESINASESSSWDSFSTYYAGDFNGSYYDRKDPCKDSYYVSEYYTNRKAKSQRNIFYSNIGIIVKLSDDGTYHFVTSNLAEGTPLKGAKVEFFNYQNQKLTEATSNDVGFGKVQTNSRAYYAKAEYKGDISFVQLHEGGALPVTHFDVGGEKIVRGVKGNIFGERGVWRPGDDIHLVFVLHDPQNAVPGNYPFELTFENPNGQEIGKALPTRRMGKFFYYQLKTQESDPTGNYLATIKLGKREYKKVVKVETIVPNRLKVELSFDKESLEEGQQKANIFSQWLHGAKASKLKTDIQVKFKSAKPKFNVFKDYEFTDISRKYEGKLEEIYTGHLDENGKSKVSLNLSSGGDDAPGMLNAQFITRVYEESGNFSQETMSIPFHPYKTYIGIKPPKGDVARGMLLTDTEHELKIASIDKDGKKVSGKKVEVRLYKIKWKWWYDKAANSWAGFSSSESYNEIEQPVNEVVTENGEASWKFQVKYPDWGRYIIRACHKEDSSAKHCSTRIIYIDWPGWAGRAQEVAGVGATRLNIYSDKKKYEVGEKAKIFLPKAQKGMALVSIEGNNKIFDKYWVKLEGKEKQVDINIDFGMAPNVYVHVSLIQPHKGKVSDTPLRLYGITPLLVEDPTTNLDFELDAPDNIRPREKFTVEVEEKSGEEMTYTLAVVDEGLLGLTKYKTPHLKSKFYSRESLGVLTWDMYDHVIGSYPAKLERLLAIGGDGGDESLDETDQNKKRRFPPIVKFLGPFTIKARDSREHEIELPNYIGAVRVMVVAGNNKSYGSREKSIIVKDDLMLLPSAPRLMGPGDVFDLPFTIFSLNDKIKTVDIELETDERVKLTGPKEKNMKFKAQGDKLGSFPVKIAENPGPTTLKFYAEGGGFSSEQVVNTKVRLPNPITVKAKTAEVKPGESMNMDIVPFGVFGTNNVKIEVSRMKPLSIDKRLGYLIRYPHGCVEQTVSSVFPQLYLDQITNLDQKNKEKIQKNINIAIDKLKRFQTSSGGFGYWPGSSDVNDWATSYALHFLVEAKGVGYKVDDDLLQNAISYQRSISNRWTYGAANSELQQAYRLYVLAKAGKPDLGAMNRLNEMKIENSSKWILAASMAQAGFADQASKLTKDLDWEVEYYVETGNTFGSQLRDYGIILSSMSLMKHKDSQKLYDLISDKLNSDFEFNTQAISFAFLGVIDYVKGGNKGESFKFSQSFDKKGMDSFSSDKMVHSSFYLTDSLKKKFGYSFKNEHDKPLYVSIFRSGASPIGKETSKNTGVKTSISYYEMGEEGEEIKVSSLEQGKEFIARIKVKNLKKKKIENIALEHLVPAGVSIFSGNYEVSKYNRFDFVDVRDDRVHGYFNLDSEEEKEFAVLLHATYSGKFYYPSTKVEAMYDSNISSNTVGQWVNIKK